MIVASSLRTAVVEVVVPMEPLEIVAHSARRISFIRREPCSG